MAMFYTFKIAGAGMKAQSDRMRVVAENLANADSTGGPGDTPYRRKVVVFENVLNKELGFKTVRVASQSEDSSPVYQS